MVGRDVLNRRLIKAIGNGKSTRVWTDPWIPRIPSYKPIGPSPLALTDLRVNDLLTPNGKQWDTVKIHDVLPLLSDTILTVRFSECDGNDQWMWANTKDGIYTTRSGYYALVEEDASFNLATGDRPQPHWMRDIWRLPCAPKIRSFLWRIFQRALPVGEALVAHGLQGQFPCPHCGQDETLYHTFFECSYAQGVWNLMCWKTPFTFLGVPLQEAYTRSLSLTTLPPTGVGLGPLSPWILWSLWKSRNLLIFQQRHLSQGETLSKAIRDAREWSTSQSPKSTVSPGLSIVAPSLATIPVPTPSALADAAWDSSLSVAGLGFCLLDSLTGRNLSFSCIEEHVSSAIVGEGLAILATMKMAIELHFSRLHIFSDSKECVDCINFHSSHRELHGILWDIHALSSRFDFISFTFVPRSFTSRVDLLAKHVLREFVLDRNFIVI